MTTWDDIMKIIDGGIVDSADRFWLHAKFADDTGHREGEVPIAAIHDLLDEQRTDDILALHVTLAWWRKYAIDPVMPPEDGRYVYVISCLNTPKPIIKIGVASSPEKRVKQLATSSPHPLRLEMARHFSNALAIEAAAHEHFHEHRQSGEWFALAPDDAISFLSQDTR